MKNNRVKTFAFTLFGHVILGTFIRQGESGIIYSVERILHHYIDIFE
jgi:hypothetical protein